MYNEYFGFREPPFSIAPDPRYLYMTAQHREALAHLVYGLNSDGGCILLTGEVGTGKTTICRCLLEQIPEKINVALVLNPKISELELLESICDELHISYPQDNKTVKTFTDRINQYLIEHNAKNERTVLIIDEAQNLDSTVLEQLRLLTNLETEQRKLLQIIILGQPELLDILANENMRQLAQRITARYHLSPLSREEIKAYINHRLAIAGQNIQLFPEATITRLYKLSNGVPRLINIICDRALLGCYVENSYNVDKKILNKAANEVSGELKKIQNGKQSTRKNLILSVLIIGMLAGIMLILFNKTNVSPQTFDSSKTPGENNTQQADNIIDETGKQETLTTTIETARTLPATSDADIPANRLDAATNSSDETTQKSLPPTPENQATQNKEASLAANSAASLNQSIENASYEGNSKQLAYQQLFSQWQVLYDTEKSVPACSQALDYGLRCLHKQGNLNSLLQHNRPAVLKLFTPTGNSAYATLTGIDGERSRLKINQQLIEVTTSNLDKHWFGQYTLLWRQPENYSRAVKPGDKGEMIRWLAKSLATINQTEDLHPSVYDAALIEAVKQFQARQGLTADGVVGPVTIIHINTALGMTVPVLKQ